MYRERYFTADTIQLKSQEMLTSVEKIRQRHTNVYFKPEKAVLLVLDLQQYFLQEDSHAFVPSAPPILPGVARLAESFSNAGCPVIFTLHANTPDDAGIMAKWWRDTIKPHSLQSQNVTTANSIKATLIHKSQYDAFFNTKLEEILRRKGMEQVVICGVMTHLCCESTARSAFMRGFEVFFTIDGTATYNEQLHRASLLTLSHGFAIPILIEELLCKMEFNET